MSQAHAALVNRILLRFSRRPGLRIWKMPTGAARSVYGNWTHFGLRGGSDIIGIAAPNGRMVAIEVKTGRDRLRPEQRAFRDMIDSHGGLFIEARSEEDVERCLDQNLE